MVRVGYPANARIAGQRESVRDEVFCQAAGITGNAGGCGTSAVSAETASGLGDLKGGEGCFVTRDSVLSDVKLREFFDAYPLLFRTGRGRLRMESFLCNLRVFVVIF
jgi:hypothetical protein